MEVMQRRIARKEWRDDDYSFTNRFPFSLLNAKYLDHYQIPAVLVLALRGDPTDVQVNTTCDPFSGDSCCSLVTSYVTEGDFFASGAPFSLLNPGFVDLDLITGESCRRPTGRAGIRRTRPAAPHDRRAPAAASGAAVVHADARALTVPVVI
jgi:hypothetical protein